VSTHPPYPDEVRQAVIEADKQGVQRKEIAKQFGISEWTIRQWAGRKERQQHSPERRLRLREQAQMLHWEGHTYVCIAKQLGISSSTAWEYVNKPYDERREPGPRYQR
jgi:transposase